MSAEALTEARAHMDQGEAAIRWVRTLFPKNADLVNNARVEQVVLDLLSTTAGDRAGGDAHLLIAASERAVALLPDADVESAIRAVAPRRGLCDYCQVVDGRIAALLPVAAPPQVVVLGLCPQCVGVLDAAYPGMRLVLPDPAPDSPERNHR